MNSDIWDRYVVLFDNGPLDGSWLARDIAATVPRVNAEVRAQEFRADLKRRVAERLAASDAAG